MLIILDDLSGVEIRELLEIQVAGMLSHSPCGACHFLDIEALKGPTVTFWSVRDNQAVAGCGALKELDSQHGEIKSMRTHPNYLRKGVARLLLDHIISTRVMDRLVEISCTIRFANSNSSVAFGPI